MSYQTLIFEEKDQIAYITLNQPKSLNALSRQVLEDLGAVAEELKQSSSVKVVIISGAGDRAFAAGANIKEMSTISPQQAQSLSLLGNKVFEAIANLPQPVIGAVNGYALGGGCELSLACDIRLASDKAVFGQPEVHLGILPGFGGSQRLPRLVGPARAKEIIYTGRNVKADEALTIGLVNQVVPADLLMAEADKLAKMILNQGQLAVQKAKLAIDLGLDLPLNRALEVEAEMFGNLFATEDQKEGMQAFIDKRQPNFKNKGLIRHVLPPFLCTNLDSQTLSG